MKIVDVSDPNQPVPVGTSPLFAGEWVRDIALAGDYAFVAVSKAGLYIVDISNPNTPRIVTFYSVNDSAQGVTVAGNYAYLAAETDGLHILDITDVAKPLLVGIYEAPRSLNRVRRVVVSGNYAYVGTSGNFDYLRIIDISDPATPVQVGELSVSNALDLSLDSAAGHLYVAGGLAGLLIIDVQTPTAPQEIGRYRPLGSGTVWGLDRQGSNVFLATTRLNHGLEIVDASDPTAPTGSSFLDLPGSPTKVRVGSSYAYVSASGDGMQIVDISDVNNPVEMGSYVPATPIRIDFDGNYIYSADSNDAVSIVNISDPAAPFLAAKYVPLPADNPEFPPQASGVAVSGDYLYVSQWNGFSNLGLAVVNVADPNNPSFVTLNEEIGGPSGVRAFGNRVYAINGRADLHILDASQPVSPTVIGEFNSPDIGQDVDIVGNFAYFVDWQLNPDDGRLRVLDISDIGNPVEVGSYDTPGEPRKIVVSGTLAFIADNAPGMQIVDVSDPQNPVQIGTYVTPRFTKSVAVSGQYAYLADWDGGVIAVDVSQPDAPVKIDSHSAGFAEDIVTDGEHIFVGSGASGLYIFKLADKPVDPTATPTPTATPSPNHKTYLPFTQR